MTPRQQQITKAAISLFLDEGVGVSTARIAAAAGVSNGTLFNAFPTKQALIDHIYVTSKKGMFDAHPHGAGAPFDRAHFFENWQAHLDWSRRNAAERQVMHLMLESGLASDPAKREVEEAGQRLVDWFATALEAGTIRGPSVDYVCALGLAQLDLAVTHSLEGAASDLAFDMLCNSIGLTT